MIHAIDTTRGLLTLDIGGAVRTMAFNTKAAFVLSLASKSGDGQGMEQSALFLYAGLKGHGKANDLPEGFSLMTAFDWLCELDNDDIETILAFGGKCMGFLTEGISLIISDNQKQNQILEAAMNRVPSLNGTV
jgi:hypothetical protein